MSRAWDKAKKGAIWLGEAGLIAGGIIGAMIGVGLAVSASAGIVGFAAAVLTGIAFGAFKFGIGGFILGGIAGGVYGAVSEDKERIQPQMVNARSMNAAILAEQPVRMAQSQEQAATKYRDLVDQSRQQQTAAVQAGI
jgi:hypothetical protein